MTAKYRGFLRVKIRENYLKHGQSYYCKVSPPRFKLFLKFIGYFSELLLELPSKVICKVEESRYAQRIHLTIFLRKHHLIIKSHHMQV